MYTTSASKSRRVHFLKAALLQRGSTSGRFQSRCLIACPNFGPKPIHASPPTSLTGTGARSRFLPE